MHFLAQKLSPSILAFRNIIHRKRRPSSAIAACNFTSERNVTNRATIPHFTLSRMEGPRELISLIHVPLWWATRTTRFPLFIEFHIKKKNDAGFFLSHFARAYDPHSPLSRGTSFRPRTHARVHVRPCARSKSFNAVVLSRLIKFPSILRISPMQLNRNSRLRDGGRVGSRRSPGKPGRKKNPRRGRKGVRGNDERSRKKCADSAGFVDSARTRVLVRVREPIRDRYMALEIREEPHVAEIGRKERNGECETA